MKYLYRNKQNLKILKLKRTITENSNSSLNLENYEWKLQRGFYVNQPFNKVVIEFVSDVAFNKVFNNSSKNIYGLDITYSYENEIKDRLDNIKYHMLSDVTYKNNKFTFKSKELTNRVAVTKVSSL